MVSHDEKEKCMSADVTTYSGKTVLITGGGTGVGADMARAFASRGADVWITGRRADVLENVAASHPSIMTHTCDVTQEADIIALFDKMECADIVIANAGAAASAPFDKTSLELWHSLMGVNLTGVFLTLREGVRRLKACKRSSGRLIAISSITGKVGYPYISAYAASKHGVLGMVKVAALEVAKTGITVNAICPGYLDTEMTEKSINNIVTKTGISFEEAVDKLKIYSPQHRLFDADEVTAAALYLASEEARGVNGQGLSVCGGET